MCTAPSLPSTGVVGAEPGAGLLHSLSEGRELEVGEVVPELGVAGCLLELPIGLGCVEDELSPEVHGLHDCLCSLSDGDFIFFSH